KVLVVDDSERLRDTLACGLRSQGMGVETAADGEQALAMLESAEFDVVVLDIVMPRVDGRRVLQQTRNWRKKPRILVLSALDQISDRVEALDLGADDYLVKPFAFAEVRARIQALGRRPLEEASPVLEVRELSIDTATKVARVRATPLALTPKEYGLLELLVRRRGHVLSRAVIFEQLYDSTSDASDSVIEALLCTLRSKLAHAGFEHLIETRRGFGYLVP
ncbi:MAG TPA: response regulator transcription factor, partial [Steroidobacteraceae bacterium]|nr:response regulator transcription factor [Steroidobacteraceae bacterium]